MIAGNDPGAETAYLLFIAGDSPNSRAATANLNRALATLGRTAHEIEIIDVYDNPEAASAARVLVTPALILRSNPKVRILGDLSATALLTDFLRA